MTKQINSTLTPAQRQSRRRVLSSLFMAALAAALVLAPLTGSSREYKDHDHARRALLSGEVLSLRQVLDLVERKYPGEPVEIEFEQDDGLYLYEIKLLQPAGTILKLKVDAATGKVLKVKGRDIERRKTD